MMKGIESTERPRKRSRISEDGEDAAIASGGKKTRGRPRVDTQDATAADRRRTQIRLAQRAYRQRKETTIASLKQQSTQLHAIIEEMNKTFLRYNDSVVQSGLLQLKPELAKDVKQMTETFATCIKSSHERTLDSDEDDLVTEEVSAPNLHKEASATATTQDSQPNGSPKQSQSWDYAAISHASGQELPKATATLPESYLTHISSSSYNLPEPNNEASIARRYRFTVGEVSDQSRSMSISQQPRATSDRYQQQHQRQHQLREPTLPFGLIDIDSREQSPFIPPYIFPINVPAMGAELPPPPRHASIKSTIPSATSLITKTLSPNYTYSYEELTFARRLMRATLEAGFLLLCSPDVHPAILNYIFKLSLPYLTLEEIRSRFKTILSRGVTEDLDWYATPFLHLGGAGTHYQRRDAQGMPIPLKNTWTIRQIGPLDRRMIRMESVADGRTQELEGIDLGGFEGEWFDSYDVQGYLEEQWHCRIDPRSSFAECLVDDDSASPSDNEMDCPSLSRGSTASNTDKTTPPASVPRSLDSFEPSYGLDMSFGNAPPPNFLSAPSKQSMLDINFDQTLGLDLAPGFDMGFAGSTGYSTLDLSSIGETDQAPVVKQKSKRVAWVDVQKMIDKMTRRAVCLGRAPGYRRKDVDTAFREALIPAY